MLDMSTIRLTVTPELRKTLDWLRVLEYPTLTDAEILKVVVGQTAVSKRKMAKKVDYSDPTPKELMRHAEYIFGLDEDDQYDEPFWDETKLKPFKPRTHV